MTYLYKLYLVSLKLDEKEKGDIIDFAYIKAALFNNKRK